MAVFKIRTFGDPVLKEKAEKIKIIDEDVKALIKNLSDTLREAKGIGLAASQIGVLKSVAVISLEKGTRVIINPEVVWRSKDTEEFEEGCLSLPGVTINIRRSSKIKLKALDKKGKEIEIEAEGMLARVIQHEIDHLNGILILDRANKEEKRKALTFLSQSLLQDGIKTYSKAEL